MTDTTLASPAPRKARRWPRVLGLVLGILLVFVVVAYFVVTSSGFFKGVILPRVSKAMNAQITVSDASISPFKQVILRDLKVQSPGVEPLLTASEVRLRYGLMDIIGGNLRVDEILVASPTVTLVRNADGSTSLDPLLQAQTSAPEKKPTESKPSKPLQVDLKKLAVTDATLRYVENLANGKRDVAELTKVNVTLDDVKNGQAAKLVVAAEIAMDGSKGVLRGKLGGNHTFVLAPDLKPSSIQGNTRLEVTRAEGALAELANFSTDLSVDVTPTDVKGVQLRFQKAGATLGELRVSGPFNMEKLEGRLAIELANVDKRLLNLAGAQSGLDFGPTSISSSSQIELAKGGTVINARGQFDINSLQVTRTNLTTPRLDLHKQFDLTVDRAQSNASLRAFTLTGTQNGKKFLNGELASPMQIGWGTTAKAVGGPLTVAISGFDLADWKPFLAEVAPAGMVSGNAKVLPQENGQVSFDFDSHVDGLTVKAGSNEVTGVSITMLASGKATEMKQFNLPSAKLTVSRDNQLLLEGSAAGTYDLAAEAADLTLSAKAALDRLLATLQSPDTSATSGKADFKAHVVQKQKTRSVTGNFTLADLSGRFGTRELQALGATADFDIGMNADRIEIKKAAGKLTQAGKTGGSFDLSATYDMARKTGGLTAKLQDVNKDGVGPFLEPMLGGKKLMSIAINANATAQYDPQGPAALKADLQVTNLVVKSAVSQDAEPALEAKMQVDASVRSQVADLRQFRVTLTPTARAANDVQLSGQVDMSNTNAIQGNLKLVADSLDLTRYYDLMTAESKVPNEAPGKTAKAIDKAEPEKEPDPIKLPFRNFTATASIGRLYLRQIEITNWQTAVKLDGGQVVIDPFKLVLNGAPVSSAVKLDLSKPGWQYALSWNGQSIPLTPLVDSLAPDQKGKVGGTASLQGQIDGAGITGASLQKNLTGQMDFATTNLNLSVVNIKNPLLKTLVNVVATLPELLADPTGKVTSIVGGLLGSKEAGKGGLADDLERSPIDTVTAAVTMGAGSINLRQSAVQSPAFRAEANGSVVLDPVLTNSTINIPVRVLLSQSMAKKLNLAENATTNTAYVALPDFVTMRGTVGAPKADIKKGVLAGTALRTITGAVPAAGESTIGAIGNILGLKSGTNQSGTNQPSKNPLKGLFRR